MMLFPPHAAIWVLFWAIHRIGVTHVLIPG